MVIRAVIFDLFDTLVDLRQENLPTEEHHGMQLPASVHAMHAALSERAEIPFERFTLAMAEASRVFAMSHFARDREVPTRLRFEDVVRRLGLADPELPEILTGVHMGVLRSEVAVPAHHAALLGVLRRRVRLGVCSNFSHSETALGILEEAGLRAHLDAIVVSDTFGLRKPRVEIFQEVLARLGVRAEEGIHVGDSLSADVQGAAALGLRSVWLTRRVPACDARLRMHAGARPDHVLPDLAELPRLLDALA